MFLIKVWSLCLSFFVAVPMPTINYRRVASKDMKYSVLLHMRGNRKDVRGKVHELRAGCSGTYISPTHILTAAHCFDGYSVERIWARGPGDALGFPVKLIKFDVGADLALVEAPYPHVYAALGGGTHVGDELLAIGSPLGFEFVASQGIASVLDLPVRGFTGTYIVSTAMIDHGSSGGGLFNKKGRLIGVNTLSIGLFSWGGLSMSVDVATIRKFLVS